MSEQYIDVIKSVNPVTCLVLPHLHPHMQRQHHFYNDSLPSDPITLCNSNIMASSNTTIFEDDTTFDLVWTRVTDDYAEEADGGFRPDSLGSITVERAPQSSSSPPQSTPVLANISWEQSSVQFTCNYNYRTRSYSDFQLVEESMNDVLRNSLAMANAWGRDHLPVLKELWEGMWYLEMLRENNEGTGEENEELWFKKQVDGQGAWMEDEDLKREDLGKYAEVEEKKKEEEEETEDDEGGDGWC